MSPAIEPEFDPPFVIEEPTRQTAPFVFNAPHAGAIYPGPFLLASRLDALTLRRSEDAHVDALFADVTALGAPLMRACFPRAYLDLNREPYELDPRMFDGRLPAFANTRSMRVAGGLGTVPRIVADGQEIYRGRLPVDEALRRIEGLYKPYHRALRGLLLRTGQAFGHAILIDCHSMPSSSLNREDVPKADIVLGDRYGTSCSSRLTGSVEAALRGHGYTVVRNKPYAGGFITEHYGEPAAGRQALQIEINRALYMDERTLGRKSSFTALAGDLAAVFERVIAEVGGDLGAHGIAAE
ncbi:N-formylglutamate amidohydrolase [Salinarimonas soli]|uniref:N-formylglutamate amidohydrolase n=1 Tax=Salinarimonas soli TaxID=1638099 RepID=A0A5B2VBS4_9HYPH|nr:N-formylglutamate amidohydrolase [Salinarimonas soli]KAA2236561.1 N-formylglutamate amidohydrolase [Salinarimonas soli]